MAVVYGEQGCFLTTCHSPVWREGGEGEGRDLLKLLYVLWLRHYGTQLLRRHFYRTFFKKKERV